MGIVNPLTFTITALFFIMTPGIDTIFILNKTIGQGKKAGIYAALGINSGVLFHTVFAALGLSLIVAKSVIAFAVLKYLGAAYLIYLGITKLISNPTMLNAKGLVEKKGTNKRNFFSGVITNILNPKVALFFLAFFPQFIKTGSMTNPVPFIILGITYAAIGVCWFLALSLFASTFSHKFINNSKATVWLNKFSGIVFILMGLRVAFIKK
jgi:threonine/homoserine/homoserine lactone efflux protein